MAKLKTPSDEAGNVNIHTGNIGDYAPGIQYFTETENTASPNTIIPVNALTVVSASDNADFAILTKGYGAIVSAIPDGTSAGGNKRGIWAVDLGGRRSNAVHVAGGARSVKIGGDNNTASGNDSAVIAGINNTNTGVGGFIGGGRDNNNSGVYGNLSGYSCSNTFDGGMAYGHSCKTKYKYSWHYSVNKLTNAGDAVAVKTCLLAKTTDATPTVMTLDLLAAGTTNQIARAGATRAKFIMSGKLIGTIANQPALADCFTVTFDLTAAIQAGAVEISKTDKTTYTGTNMVGCAFRAIADVTNEAITFEVTGLAATDIGWHLVLDINRVEL